jgi:arylsulfatase
VARFAQFLMVVTVTPATLPTKQHNQPQTLEEIQKYNDLEPDDLSSDPGENDNLLVNSEQQRELIEKLIAKINALIESEICEDIGQMLPHSDVTSWSVDRFDP